ncbi:MAG TPA: RIP metalloprotease RseP [Candidatus Polarisedimenticolaceae bacterium]|nr:RIP metalloprotease RseP [Candidatus Polarisedimenticolaceae bacterium]
MIKLLEFVLAFVLVLAPLVFIHELGHFLAAKAFRVGVSVFSLGFGPRLAGFRRRETDYRISLIPLGGYVRMIGDESDEHRSGASNEFLSKPRWQRFIVFIAGAAFNIVLAFVVMWFYFATFGKIDAPYPEVYAVAEGSEAEASGVRRGDKLVEISGNNVQGTRDFLYHYNVEIALAPETLKTIVVERDGERVPLRLNTGLDEKLGIGDPGWGVGRGGNPVIGEVFADGAAAEAGLQPGDRIVAAGSKTSITGLELQVLIEASVGREVRLLIERDGRRLPAVVRPRATEDGGKIGISFVTEPLEPVPLDVGQAAVESFRWNLDLSKTLFVVLKRMVTTELSIKTMSGPVGIAQVARQALLTGVDTFLYLLAFFSLQLGILNLMPIPILDGGHILILIVEGVMRRNLSEAVKERVMQAGLVFLIAFMGVVIFLDVVKIL